jgi:heavy metal efflux system protein
MLRIQGLPANLISMGAIDFGLLLEGTLVIVETVFVAMEKKAHHLGMAKFNRMSKMGLIKKSAGSVATYIVFAQIILIVALLPIFSFKKWKEKCSHPWHLHWAMPCLGSLILSITYVPALCKVLLTKNIVEKENFISRFFRNNLFKLFLWSNRRRKATLSWFYFYSNSMCSGFSFLWNGIYPQT